MKTFKKIVIIAAFIAVFLLLVCGFFMYKLYYAVETVDKSESPNGKYTLQLQSIGSPVFFSSADGRLVLKEGKKKITTHEFTLSDDGGSVRPGIWQVFWEDDYVEVLISGDEQNDELIKINYNGESDSEQLNTRWGKLLEGNNNADKESSIINDTFNDYQTEGPKDIQVYERQIFEGYKAIYEAIFQKQNCGFSEEYDAKGNSRIILYEDDFVIKYLVYDRKSANEKCGLYVYYSSQKKEDGSWSSMEASILDTYAYVYDNGDVISSGKTDWGDTGTDAYTNAAGEP